MIREWDRYGRTVQLLPLRLEVLGRARGEMGRVNMHALTGPTGEWDEGSLN